MKNNKYTKVSNDLEADIMVQKRGYKYVSRSEWKKNVRDFDKDLKKVVSEKGMKNVAIAIEKENKKVKKNDRNTSK